MERFTTHSMFEKGSCISQDKLMDYHEKKLSAKNQHEIERHLINCGFCSEALEGFAIVPLSENSLEAMNQRVKALTANHSNRTIIWRAGMALAASVIGILIGIFWLLSNYSSSQNMVAENKKEIVSEPVKQVTKTEPDPEKLLVLAESVAVKTTEQTPIPEQTMKKSEKVTALVNKDNDEMPDLAEAEEVVNIETSVAEPIMAEMQEVKEIQFNGNATENFISQDIRSKTAARQSPITEINNYKVVDYSNEYTSTDAEESSVANQRSGTSAKYESPENIEKSMEETTITRIIPYEEVLKKAIKSMDDGNYAVAIDEFSNILKKYPSDENATFYSGYCNYQNKKYSKAIGYFETVLKLESRAFYEEAKWYLALSFRDENKKEKAQKIFQEIVNENGFYKEKAVKALEEID